MDGNKTETTNELEHAMNVLHENYMAELSGRLRRILRFVSTYVTHMKSANERRCVTCCPRELVATLLTQYAFTNTMSYLTSTSNKYP